MTHLEPELPSGQVGGELVKTERLRPTGGGPVVSAVGHRAHVDFGGFFRRRWRHVGDLLDRGWAIFLTGSPCLGPICRRRRRAPRQTTVNTRIFDVPLQLTPSSAFPIN